MVLKTRENPKDRYLLCLDFYDALVKAVGSLASERLEPTPKMKRRKPQKVGCFFRATSCLFKEARRTSDQTKNSEALRLRSPRPHPFFSGILVGVAFYDAGPYSHKPITKPIWVFILM